MTQETHALDGASPPLAGGPPMSSPTSPPDGVRSELDEVRRRLHELQGVLTDRFTRQHWDEYIRLRRAARSQHA